MADLESSLGSLPDFLLNDKLDTWQLKKRDRVRLIMEKLRRLKKVKIKRFLAWMEIHLGTHPRTAKQYMKSLQDIDQVKIDGYSYVWVGEGIGT